MNPFSRRQLIASGALASLALVTSTRRLHAAHHEKHTFQIGACDWSIGQRGSVNALSVAKTIGLDGVQVTFGPPGEGDDLRDPAVREKYAQLSEQTGVRIASLGMGVLNKIPFSTDDRAEQWVADCIDTMPKMNQKIVLLAFFGEGDINGKPELQKKVIERLKRLAPRAEERGLTLGLETWLDAPTHEAILDAVDSPAVKVYYDTANMQKMGYDIHAEIRRLGADRICEIHCKENGFLLGQGKCEFPKVREALADIDYKGWLIIESATVKNRDRIECYQHNQKYLRGLFNA
jgi:sugar phosphate isomerase/epimerase